MTTPVENEQYINRDISWLEFNARVLGEATDKGNALLERLKFIAIFSSNLDEFYMVRVAGVKQQLGEPFKKVYGDSGYVPAELMDRLDTRIRALVDRQYRLLYKEVLPELAQNGISLLAWKDLTQEKRDALRKHFISNWLPILTPIGIDSSHPFPQVPNLGLELLVRLSKENDDRERFAILEVPSLIPRFIEVEVYGHRASFITSEELIANNLDLLFSKCTIFECSAFRITRDMDFSIDEESIADLLTEMQIALQKKARRKVVRLEISSTMSRASREWLAEMLKTSTESIFSISGMLNLKDLFRLAGLKNFPELVDKPLPPLASVNLPKGSDIFRVIREKGGFLLHHPYESFSPVIHFLEEAANDPNVLAIKQTLYRVSGNSPVVNALIRAARSGKQVSVLVEIKARFDEENNINWARELANAGAHVVYGIAGLKVHCKALMVVRQEEDGIHRYMHLGTGNYNDKTAQLYTDLGFFTDDKSIADDVSALFNVITGFSSPPDWNKLWVAPFNIKEKLIYHIDRESELSTPQNPGSISMKVNSLIDYEIIDHLYEAAQRHVKINLIVRGICGLNPFSLPKQFAKNITVVSILDRFLEHARIYRFGNNGDPVYYIGSADVMQRNIRRRIEVLTPIEAENLRRELDFILDCGLHDKRKGRRLIGANKFSRPTASAAAEPSRSQYKLYDFYKTRLEKAREMIGRDEALTIFTSPEKGEEK